jgi:F-type H+-transporting ATPase subunit gamma
MLISHIPYYLNNIVYHAWLNSKLSESVKRMLCTDNASKNSKKILGILKRKYNKMRQDKVTKELIDIIAGQL